MQRLWGIVDDHERRPDRPRRLLQGALLAAAALLLMVACRYVIGVDLPFAIALVAVAIAAAWGGALTACVAAAATIVPVLVLNADHPFVTPVNTLAVVVFSIVLALFGGHMTALRRRADLAAQRSNRRELYLQSIFNRTPAAMLIADAADNIVAINMSARAILAVGDHAATDLRLIDLLPGWTGADSLSGPHVMERADGKRLTLAISSVALPFDATDLRTVYIRDETDQAVAAEELALLQAELQQLARATALGQLGSAIAHELNQPLAVAANFAQVAQRALDTGRDGAAVREALDGTLQHVFRAAAVLKRLRQFVQRGPLKTQWHDAQQVIAEGAKLGALAIRQADARLSIHLAPDLGEIRIDPVQIQQVLLNLMSNAAHAVSPMAIREVELVAQPGPPGRCTITVSDTGPGIAAAMEPAIFAPFRTNKPEGLGVGLAICRTIVEAHDGTISAGAGERGGARFSFTLPRRAAAGEMADAA